jgi:hypothetical protein
VIMEKVAGLLENLKLTKERIGVRVIGAQISGKDGGEPHVIGKVFINN